MLITLEDLKNHIGLDSNDDDEIIATYISAVGDVLKNHIGRVIEEETVTEYFDGDDITDKIFLSNYPLTAFTSFQYRTGTYAVPVWNNFNTEDYQTDLDGGVIYTDNMYNGVRNIKVVYKAGYAAASIPSALKLAALKLVAKVYNKKRSDGFSHEEAGGAAIDWDKFLSDDIKALISPYCKINI